LRPRFLWGVAPKAPDCVRGIFPQNLSQTPFISKPPDFFGLSTAAWVLRFRQKSPRTLMNESWWCGGVWGARITIVLARSGGASGYRARPNGLQSTFKARVTLLFFPEIGVD